MEFAEIRIKQIELYLSEKCIYDRNNNNYIDFVNITIKFETLKAKEEREVRVILNSIYAFKLFKIFIFALQKIQHTI